jgi:hypothetical protein
MDTSFCSDLSPIFPQRGKNIHVAWCGFVPDVRHQAVWESISVGEEGRTGLNALAHGRVICYRLSLTEGGKDMPVLEFALDAHALNRIQVHINTHQGPVSVMLNRTVLGSLATMEEQTSGKNFRLPDNAVLRVQILNGHPQAWRNGLPLLLASVPPSAAIVAGVAHGHLGTGVRVLMVLNLLVIGSLCFWFLSASLMNISVARPLYPLLYSGLLALIGLAGICLLLTWRKRGLYLALGAVLANFGLAVASGTIDYRTFLPLATLLLLTFALHSTGIWHQMR